MMSNSKFWHGLAWGLFGVLTSIASAENATPGRETLEAMGLGGLQMMSDDEGLEVRGQGFATAWGQSWASVGKAGSTNGYLAVGPHYASGENFSEAGIRVTTTGGGNGNHYGGKNDGGWGGDPPRGNHGGSDWKNKGPRGGGDNHHPKNGDMHGKPKGDRGKGGGGMHGGKPKGGHGKGGGKPNGGHHGGGKPGGGHHGGGKPQTKSIRVYAGGYSSARAG